MFHYLLHCNQFLTDTVSCLSDFPLPPPPFLASRAQSQRYSLFQVPLHSGFGELASNQILDNGTRRGNLLGGFCEIFISNANRYSEEYGPFHWLDMCLYVKILNAAAILQHRRVKPKKQLVCRGWWNESGSLLTLLSR